MSLLKFNFFKFGGFYSIVNHSSTSINSSLTSKFVKLNNFDSIKSNVARSFHSSAPYCASHFKHRDRKELMKSIPKLDEGTAGENTVSLDAIIKTREDMFTDEKTPNLLFNGVPFREIPIVHVKVTKNNTIVALSNHEGKVIAMRSCGMEGFKNCRKGTNVAGQTTALSISAKAVRIGIKDVRLKIQGLGPGRLASIKGVQMGGLNIISVTDDTRITFRPTIRARKVRRI